MWKDEKEILSANMGDASGKRETTSMLVTKVPRRKQTARRQTDARSSNQKQSFDGLTG